MNNTFLHDDDLEAVVLGSMITSKDCALIGVASLTIDDFFIANKANREIFKAMKELEDIDSPIDPATLASQLRLNKVYDEVGGTKYLTSLIDKVTIYQTFETYINRLKEFTLLRKLVNQCDEIINKATSKELSSISDFLRTAEKNINEITSKRKISEFKRASEIAEIVGAMLQKSNGEDKITGLRTGFISLDKKINGLGKGQLIVVAARPGVGKSALALNMCYNIARRSDDVIAYFSLEMSNEELMRRLFAISSGVPQHKINTGFLSIQDKSLLKQAEKEISNTDIYFEESPGVTIDEIAIKCRRLKEQKDKLSLIVIDHLGIIQPGAHNFKSNQEKLEYFTHALKTLSLELNVPILLVCHINRGAEQKENRIPEISELRGSGSIENDADKILLLYRLGYYKSQGIDVKTKKGFGDNENEVVTKEDDNRGQKMDIIVGKNRQGETGKVTLLFFPAIGRFAVPSDDTLTAMDRLAEAIGE